MPDDEKDKPEELHREIDLSKLSPKAKAALERYKKLYRKKVLVEMLIDDLKNGRI